MDKSRSPYKLSQDRQNTYGDYSQGKRYSEEDDRYIRQYGGKDGANNYHMGRLPMGSIK